MKKEIFLLRLDPLPALFISNATRFPAMSAYLAKIDDFVNTLEKDALSALAEISQQKVFKKGEFLLRQGEICTSSFLIGAGVARKYYLHDGKEITTELYFAEDLAISFESYVMQQPAREFIQALDTVQATVTNHSGFLDLKKRFPSFATLDLMMTEYYALWLEERLFEFHTLNATERYLLLLEKHSHVIRYIPLTHIASYLGISLETLSRIRARISG